MKGRVSSFQSMGAVDGPGLRSVLFMQGCPLRCAYCHNPETWEAGGGAEISVDEAVEKIKRMFPYIKKKGGVTLSGGEPLMQPAFAAGLFRRLHELGCHTALDTSGACLSGAEEALRYTGLVICDIKFTNEEDFEKYCGGRLDTTLGFLDITARMNVPLWVRQVIAPGINDTEEDVMKLKEMARKYHNLEKIELLPFRKLCLAKYDALGIKFPLRETPECGEERLQKLQKLISAR